jgi:hypothetical protein
VKVADGGNPQRTSTTVLTINVNQNLNTPEFDTTGGPCSREFSEDTAPGSFIASVTATDSDPKVL